MTAGPAVRHILEAYYGVEQSKKDPHPTDTQPIGVTPEKTKAGTKGEASRQGEAGRKGAARAQAQRERPRAAAAKQAPRARVR